MNHIDSCSLKLPVSESPAPLVQNRVVSRPVSGYHSRMSEQFENDYKKIRQAIAYLSRTSPADIDMDGLCRALGLDRRRFTGLFRRWCGLSPKSFVQAVALDRAKSLLKDNASVLETSLEVGLSSSSRLHDLFVTHHSMPPGAWARKGEGLVLRWGTWDSPFGKAMIFVSDYGVAGLGFVDGETDLQEENRQGSGHGNKTTPKNPDGREIDGKALERTFGDLAQRWPRARFIHDDNHVMPFCQRIFMPGLWQPDKPVRVVLIGTDFEISVWKTLLKIPLGRVTTYGDVARHIGRPGAARAVGAAVGRNPISFVVPCHRVVGAKGKLTGYHWGMIRKRAILGWETGQKSP